MSTPLVGDERIAKHFDIHVEGYYDELEPERKAYEKRVRVLAAQWTRDIYEAELQSLRERLSRMEEAGNAMREFIKDGIPMSKLPDMPLSLVSGWDALSNK